MNQWQGRWASGAQARLVLIIAFVIISATASFAQDEPATINKSLIPPEGTEASGFAPAGWKLEGQVTGDLNGDGLPDYALILVEAKLEKNADGDPTERGRALVIALATKDGKLKRAGVADKLLQCTRCGGAFYGVVETPVEVTIEKGVVVVQQDHGSRNLTNTTYRFRLDPATQQFVLIGFDYADADRATAKVVSESTNYATGVRVVSRDRGNREIKTRRVIPKIKISIDNVDSGKFEEDAAKRLGLY